MIRAVFALASLWSALLLFEVQPMLGKRLLPWFGGSTSTWTTCMLFFQLALLLGYAFADLIVRRLPRRLGSAASLALPVCALALLPLGPGPEARPVSVDAPVATILLLLGTHALVPYVALATSAPLLQHAYERATGRPAYGLYAFSNAGSLLGLLCYPLVLEPLLDLSAQQRLWSWGFAASVALMGATAWLAQRHGAAAPGPIPGEHQVGRTQLAWWIALSCVPSAMLLAVTAYITVDVAAVPFLWVLPLALYLLSFIVTFGRARASPRLVLLAGFAPAVALLAVTLFAQGTAPLAQQVGSPLLVLLVTSLLLHGELVRLRPAPALMSRFYLAVSLGGALGGVLVALVAPIVFAGFYELPLAAIAASVLATVIVIGDRGAARRALALRFCYFALGMSLPLVGATIWVQGWDRSRSGEVIEQQRGFFGVLRVTDIGDTRLFSHGRIRHGMQFRDERRRNWPTLYQSEQSGVGRALRLHAASRARQIGIVGLGAGTLATYGQAGDRVRFYELSPEVVDVAGRQFDFLRRSRAVVTTVTGDGRLSLEREAPQGFDVLVLDAFASDAVPAHLLTVEAFRSFLRHLRPDGVIAANVSNRHVAVERVVLGAARRLGLAARLVASPRDLERGAVYARWVLLARSGRTLDPLVSAEGATAPWGNPVEWTDAYSNLLRVLR